MDTSEFRKPRPDFPIVPESAITRPRVKGFKVPRGRKGKKPRGKRTPLTRGHQEGVTALKPPNRYREARTREIKENARDRRERLQLEKEISREQIRYRETKVERERRKEAVRLIESRRVQVRQDRLIEDQARHFSGLLAQGERRAGEIQEQYKDFVQAIMSQRNLEYKPEEIKIRYTKGVGGASLFEEEEQQEEVGGLRKPERVVKASVREAFGGAGLDLSLEEDISGESPLIKASRKLKEETSALEEELKAVTPSVPFLRATTPPPRPHTPRTPEQIVKQTREKKRLVETPPAPAGKDLSQTKEDKAREFIANAPQEYRQAGGFKGNQTQEQIQVSQEFLKHRKTKQTDFQTLSKQFRDDEIVPMTDTQQELFMVVSEQFGGAGAEKHAGVYKVRNLPAQEGTAEDSRSGRIHLQSVFGDERGGKAKEDRFGDIGTINPYKEVKGVNPFQQGIEEGKIKFFLADRE